MTGTQLHRSLLFSPGIRPELMEKADRSGADALILDLEDSVPVQAKAEARHHVAQASARAGLPIYVRVNHPESGDTSADIDAIAGDRVQGVFLPKSERPDDIRRLETCLRSAESRLGKQEGSLTIVPMIESCDGLRHVYGIVTASERVRGIAIASAEEGDLMVDIGGRWTPDGVAMLYPRGRLACEARAAGIGWLIDGVFMNLKDDSALRSECRIARNMGYVGKLAVHPRQIAVIHEVFTPSSDEVEYARGLVAAFHDAERQGRGAIQYRGMMVDYANVKRAQRTLALARG